jgi:hypothetical protein
MMIEASVAAVCGWTLGVILGAAAGAVFATAEVRRQHREA